MSAPADTDWEDYSFQLETRLHTIHAMTVALDRSDLLNHLDNKDDIRIGSTLFEAIVAEAQSTMVFIRSNAKADEAAGVDWWSLFREREALRLKIDNDTCGMSDEAVQPLSDRMSELEHRLCSLCPPDLRAAIFQLDIAFRDGPLLEFSSRDILDRAKRMAGEPA